MSGLEPPAKNRCVRSIAMFLSLFVGHALALNCDDVTELINAGVSAELVSQTIRAAAPVPSAADIDCLVARHSPQPVVDAAYEAAGIPQPVPVEIAAPSTCGAETVRVNTSGLTPDYAAAFTARAEALPKYLMSYCRSLGVGTGFDVQVTWDDDHLTILIIDPAFVPAPNALVTGQREPFNGISLERQTALANLLLGWSLGTMDGRPLTDPLRRAIVEAEYAVVYRRPERNESMGFPFIRYAARMYPQGTIVFAAGKSTTIFTDTTPPDGLFALDAPNVPSLSGKLSDTAAVYAFFDVPLPE